MTAAPRPALPLSDIVAGAWRLAAWQWSVAERVRWIEGCLDLGVTSFDHADIYGDYQVESLFGEALAAAPALRERLTLVTKTGIRLLSRHRPDHGVKSYDTSVAHVTASVEQSLRALRTDRLDVLLLHRPDHLLEPDALAAGVERLIDAGKVRTFGVSNFTPAQFAMLDRRIPLVTHQVELSPLALGTLADGTLDQCTDLGVRPMLWSPLAGGRLFTGDDERAVRVREVLGWLGARHGVSAATVAYAWLLRHPSRPVPITGSRRLEAIAEAVAARALRLTAEEWYQVREAGAGHPVP
jgi:predicted oxidoreductase